MPMPTAMPALRAAVAPNCSQPLSDHGAEAVAWWNRRTVAVWLVGVLIAVSGWVLTLGIQTPWPWSDEGATYLALQRTWNELPVLLSSPDAPIVPYYLLAKAWTQCLQALWPALPTIVAVRLLSAAAGVGTVLALYTIVARNAGRAVGMLAALLLLALPGFDRYAQEARTYELLALAATVSWLVCDRRLRPGMVAHLTGATQASPRPSRPLSRMAATLGYAASLAVVVVLHTFGMFQWAAHAVATLASPGDRRTRTRRLAAFAVVLALAAAIAAAQVIPSVAHGTGPSGPTAIRVVTPASTLAQLLRGVSDTASPIVSIPVLLFAAAGAWIHRRTVFLRRLLIWVSVPLILEISLGAVRTNLFRLRYWIAFLSPFAAIAALGIAALATQVAHTIQDWRPSMNQTHRDIAIVATTVLMLAIQVVVTTPAQQHLRARDGHREDLSQVLTTLAHARATYPDLTPAITSRFASGMLAAADPALLAENPLRYIDASVPIVYTTPTPARIVRERLAGARYLLWIYRGEVTASEAVARMSHALAQLHPAVVWARPAGTRWTTLLLTTAP